MGKDIKLICSDIDGTLLNAERWLSDETISAFAKAGLPTILASSRPPQAMRYLQEGLGILESPLIAFNGGLIIGPDNKIIESNTFTTEVLGILIDHHKKHTYNLSIYSYENWFTAKEDAHTKHEIFTTRDTPQIRPVEETLKFLNANDFGIHKLMCMGSSDELDSIVSLLSKGYNNDIHLYRSKDTYLEITPKHIDKAVALDKLLAQNQPFDLESVIAFGDNHNDNELIRRVGLGIAVGNATDALKSLAKYVSPFTNKENAVARAINKFLIED